MNRFFTCNKRKIVLSLFGVSLGGSLFINNHKQQDDNLENKKNDNNKSSNDMNHENKANNYKYMSFIDHVDNEPYKWNPPKSSQHENVYTIDEVSKHNSRNSLWVTYKDGVYDVTEFVNDHPGGSQLILDAGGGPVDSFWNYWSYHYISKKVPMYLNKYRIGRLSDYKEEDYDDLFYEDEPERDNTKQRILTERPYCSEAQPIELIKSFLTSNEAFYVRNHAPVPLRYMNNALSNHQIEFCVNGNNCETLNINQMMNFFKSNTITSVLQCAGNRAEEMSREADNEPTGFTPTPYKTIKYGLIGNAKWEGFRLYDILSLIMPQDTFYNIDKKHVIFEGSDGYTTSVPLVHIMNRDNDVILATHMNNDPLPPDHGYPIRLLLPGIAGARNVKWLRKIIIQNNDESNSCWQAHYYKTTDAQSITTLPMQSLIFNPMEGANIDSGESITMKGIAWGVGSTIKKVLVSADAGKTWSTAEINSMDENIVDDSSRRWSWVRWSSDVVLPKVDKNIELKLMVRCFDENGNEQPENIFHHRGYLYNAYHRVLINVRK